MNLREAKKIRTYASGTRAILTVTAFALSFYLLKRFEYISQFLYIDNFIGFLPVALVITGYAAFVALLFIERKRSAQVLCVCLAVVSALCYSLFPNALECNWWINYGQPQTTENEPDLSIYAPFAPDNKLASLDAPAIPKIDYDLPQLDGAVALYPVYAAFAQAFYDKTAFEREGGVATADYVNNGERVIMTNTLRAYDGLINGERDVIFVAGASANQRRKAQSAGVEFVFTPIGKEAFVFIVPDDNPVKNLTYQQIKNVYSGKTAYWRTLGYDGGGKIIAFQRPDGSGSQTGLQNLMGDIPLIAPQPLPDRSLAGTNSLMTQMTAEYKGARPALGYSYKYFATEMYKNERTKLLSVNGVYPSAQNISDGSYPFTVDFYAVTVGAPDGNVKALIDLILSDEGQTLIEKTGYARIKQTLYLAESP